MTDHELSPDEHEASMRPVAKLCDLIIAEGLLSGASAIHLLPTPAGCHVRYQIQGDWRQQMTLPVVAAHPLMNRVRVMANLDRTSVPRPHAGEMRCLLNGQEVHMTAEVRRSASGGEEMMIMLPKPDSV